MRKADSEHPGNLLIVNIFRQKQMAYKCQHLKQHYITS